MVERYFDNAATTPVDSRVLKEMLPFLTEDCGNAHSIHAFGAKARAAVELARDRVANLIGAEDPSQLVFTSGATEANNWVVSNFPDGCYSPFEHSSVLEPARALGLIPLDPDGLGLQMLDRTTSLISLMSVNNETGTQFEVCDWSEDGQAMHTDATQAVGKIPFEVADIDFVSFSGHKFYAPKGIGALYMREPIEPFILGGGQEDGLRGGTLNVPGIVGIGVAAELAAENLEQDFEKAESLKAIVLDEISRTADWQINGGPLVSPFILNVSFLGMEGETLVIEADRAGFAISAGAACSSGSTELSHVLLAFGLPVEWIRGSIRISFGRFNTERSSEELGRSLVESVEKLRTMK